MAAIGAATRKTTPKPTCAAIVPGVESGDFSSANVLSTIRIRRKHLKAFCLHDIIKPSKRIARVREDLWETSPAVYYRQAGIRDSRR
jgi:hypothetical protein